MMEIVDIAVNLTGWYNGKQSHTEDLSSVLDRGNHSRCFGGLMHAAYAQGVQNIMITGTDEEDSFEALKLARTDGVVFVEKGEEQVMNELKRVLEEGKGKISAIGECGLDYERTQYCSPDLQKIYFEKQFELSELSGLPIFFHLRDAADDFIDIVRRNRHRFTRGTLSEAERLIGLDLYIGINGCSLKTEENVNVVKSLPLDRLMVETDAPWCEIRKSHAGHKYVKTEFTSRDKKKWSSENLVKGRNEPCAIIQVVEVIAGCQGKTTEEVCRVTTQNAKKVFFHKE
ncbi:putative deoxyribonuclease [Planoprotostelium fungivorum]|uniref:Putative deoxyribonuclease n=1 Tax=Planoprotostelium fungivorum TaxID=1890364 RepID=A0A2P6NFE9_9EUKA|nr:putative deoxyribonuclease [Planoprotostelium fungivorum]